MNVGRSLFIIPSLRGGGAERVFTLVLNGLAARGFDMHLALCQNEGCWLERLSPAVTVHDLRSPRVRQAGWPLSRLVRSLRPQSVLSTSSHLNTIAGLFRPLFPRQSSLVLREVNINHLEPAMLKGLRGTMMRRGYQAADKVICLTDGMRELVTRHLRVPSSKLVRIFNPLERTSDSAERCASMAHAAAKGKRLVAIGTLEHRKGFDRIIAALPRLLERFPESTLTIFGDGLERAALESQARKLGLTNQIRLPGFSSSVANELRNADLFVMASRFEGLPNVLLEAIGARCPFVVVDHPGGTREVVELLGEEQRLTTALDAWKPDWFESVAPRTVSLAQHHFGYDSIVQQYANVLFPEAASRRLAA